MRMRVSRHFRLGESVCLIPAHVADRPRHALFTLPGPDDDRVPVLAGYPVVDFKVVLTRIGEKIHVDSNELSFKTAGRIAFKKAMEQAKPALLEPIMNVEITIPDEFAGAIMGDLNSRRGRIQGMDNKAGKTIVRAEVPMAEMLTYGTDLTSMTQGRGSFSMEMDHYDFVPAANQEKIIAAAKAERGEVVEEEE